MGGGGNQIVTGTGFWHMGGYARYVWPCFAFAGVILGWNLWSARRYRVAAQLRARRALAMAGTATAPITTIPRAAGEKA
jgi:heme exporter protein CcmD